jgi:hypothetical protein
VHAVRWGGQREVIEISNIFTVSKLVSVHYGKRAGGKFLIKIKEL